jgi:hypothetical protein
VFLAWYGHSIRRYGWPVAGSELDEVLAAVVFEAPHGRDGLVLSGAMAPAVPFGRGGHCPVRFGYAPNVDTRLARQAGAFLIAGSRVIVESSAEQGHPPLQVRFAGRPPIELSHGELYAPSIDEFDVIVRGERDWTMTVRTRRLHTSYRSLAPAGTDDDPPTHRFALLLTEHEQRVLDAYLAPLKDGRLEPATHSDVADVLHFSANKIRGDLYEIWSKMVTAGVAMPEYADKRVAVTSAAIAHGLA